MSLDAPGQRRVWKFPGGLRLDPNKAIATSQPVAVAPVPRELVLQLLQHTGGPARPVVSVGEQVLRGQLVAEPEGFISAAVHAPTSGRITAIEDRPVAHPSGLAARCIILESDGEDNALGPALSAGDYHEEDPAVVRSWVRDAGIVGLGGAVFPTSVKLTAEADQHVHTLLLNGAECEPNICCDDMLMREQPQDVLEGGQVMLHILQINQCVIAIEEDKPEAIAAMREAVKKNGDDRFEIVPVPAIYPEGGEKQLIQALSGVEVPADGLPLDAGFVCQNVGTAAAVADAVVRGRPLDSRIITVTGNGIAQPQNVRVRIGTLLQDLISFCGGYTENAQRLVLGGPMMGFTLPRDDVPVVKAMNCILVLEDVGLRDAADIMPCIRCGECARACPASLLPQQLYWSARSDDSSGLLKQHIFDCIECGCCDYVCPSQIPLAQYFRHAKAEIRGRDVRKLHADIARQRFENRERRLAQQKQELEQRRAQRKAADSTASGEDAVLAAVERARAKRQKPAPDKDTEA